MNAFRGALAVAVRARDRRDEGCFRSSRDRADGSLVVKGKAAVAKFGVNDVLEFADAKMSIADDGSVTFVGKDGKVDPDRVQFQGFTPSARRTALILIVAAHATN